ncbi:MAG: alpha/beta fold hydrolase, partial [Sneathiella sp.]|nr:alpha/beta fold hydrolase [Sneathiella sp.]
RPYRFLASSLASNGHIAVTLDPRGHGKSLPHPKRGVDYGYDDILQKDLPATLDHLRQEHPDLPIFMIGHSLAAIYPPPSLQKITAA